MISATLPEPPPVVLPAPQGRKGSAEPREGRGWPVLVCLWLLALGYVALTATTFRGAALAADRWEAAVRAQGPAAAGRGAFDAYAAAQPPTMYDPDSQCWIALTQKQIAEGSLRPRVYPYDNAPDGHQQHWSASFNWWLLAVGAVTQLCTGLPLAEAVAQSAAWANPILLGCFLTALALALRRRLAAWPLGVLLVTLAALYGVEWDFSYGRPDHHGLHLMAFLGLALGALAGGLGWVVAEEDSRFKSQASRKEQARREKRRGKGGASGEDGEAGGAGWHLVQPRTRREARGWFTASGACGGIGLWIGSTQQCVCIAALGAGAVLGGLLFARRAEPGDECHYEPELWRHWARVGAATSLFFYLLEGFPGHWEMRLEVNHPFISLGWLGAGELMCLLLRSKVQSTRSKEGSGFKVQGSKAEGEAGRRWQGREWIWQRAVLGLLGMSLLPLALVCGPKAWWVLADPLLLHTTLVVTEGRPWIDPPSWGLARHMCWIYTGALTLALPAAGVILLAGRGRKTPPCRLAGLTALTLLAVVFLGWTLLQTRWMGFLECSLAVLALLAAPCVPLPATLRRQHGALLALLALTVPGWLAFGSVQMQAREEDPMALGASMLEGMMSTKEAAWNLRRDAESLHRGRAARVMGPPSASPALHYYGGLDTVGSYYWENLPGCHAAVDFFLDESGEAARRAARERGIDFVLVTARPAFVLEMQWLRMGKVDLAAAPRTLAFRLANGLRPQPPEWLEAVPLVDAPLAERAGVRIYRVVRERL